MNIATLNTAMRAAITGYAATLNAWAQSKYTKNHTLIVRADMRDSPGEDECPCCAFTPANREASQENRIAYYTFGLDVMVFDDTVNGFTNLETYRKHLQDILVATAATNDLVVVDIAVAYDIEDAFPFLWCGMQVKFKETFVIGQNPIE